MVDNREGPMLARTLRIGVLTLPAAAAASGQGTMTFSWTTDDTGDRDGVIEPGESAVVTLWAFMDPRRVAFAGSIYDIAGDTNWQTRGSIDHRVNLIDNLAVGPGELHADNSITGIEAFQFPPFFGDLTDPSNPLAIYEIVWTPTDHGHWRVGFWSENHQNASVYTDNFGNSVEYAIVIEPGSMRVVPGPSVLAVLGCAFAARRRGR
jgi:hypothetical protein